MSPERPDEFDVRRLCRMAHILSARSGQPAKPHPLGLGIKRKHQYTLVGRKPARLPVAPIGLEQIRSVISKPIAWLADELAPVAWGNLIGQPRLLVELLPPSLESLLEAGFTVPASTDMSRLRQLAIATVVHPATLAINDDYELTDFRLAGVARIILLTSPNRPDTSEEAWLEAEWTDSSVRLAEQLERLLNLAPDETRHIGRKRPALLFAAPDVAERLGSQLKAAALVCGFHLSIYTEHEKGFYGEALKEIRASAPLVLVQHTVRNNIVDILRVCEGVPDCHAVDLDDRANEILLDEVRRKTLAEVGIGASLFVRAGSLIQELTVEPPASVLPPLPLTVCTAITIHKTFGRFERGNEFDGWHWFSRDRAGHGGIAFKKFIANQSGLTWAADLDDAGRIVTAKHKGDVGRYISWSEFSIVFLAPGTPGIGG
jgi:hypothetical protein